MTEKLDKYILDIEIDNETGEEHCTILKTDRTTNANDWITIISAMYTHHSVFEPLIKELNKLSEENEELKQFQKKVFELIDMKIKHYSHKPISAPAGQPMSVNFDPDVDRLARLSELQQLKKELE